MPHWDNLRAYTGYFSTKDLHFHDPDFLTKLWYSGAYTVQTNTIDSPQARQFPYPEPKGWANNATGGPVTGPILVDGAKRDRTVWPGDLRISTHTELVALNDLLPSRNGLLVMFSTQDPATGALQYSGPPINAQGSDAYIAWSLIGTHNVYLYTGDLDLVRTVWPNYTKALAFLEGQMDDTGMANVPVEFSNNWGRDGGQGHNSAANVLLYRALVTGSELATFLGDTELAGAYAANASALKDTINNVLWDDSAGMYRDNETTTLRPVDANSLAVLFNVTQTQEQNKAISEGLTHFWTDIGPISPELKDTIIPFIGGFELRAHFIAREGERALDLMHKGIAPQKAIILISLILATATVGQQGPTSALTFHVLGITLMSTLGRTWKIAPVLSDLESAEGGFETGLGWFGVKWRVEGDRLTVEISTPKDTSGIVELPGIGPVQTDRSIAEGDGGIGLDGGDHVLTRSLA